MRLELKVECQTSPFHEPPSDNGCDEQWCDSRDGRTLVVGIPLMRNPDPRQGLFQLRFSFVADLSRAQKDVRELAECLQMGDAVVGYLRPLEAKEGEVAQARQVLEARIGYTCSAKLRAERRVSPFRCASPASETAVSSRTRYLRFVSPSRCASPVSLTWVPARSRE